MMHAHTSSPGQSAANAALTQTACAQEAADNSTLFYDARAVMLLWYSSCGVCVHCYICKALSHENSMHTQTGDEGAQRSADAGEKWRAEYLMKCMRRVRQCFCLCYTHKICILCTLLARTYTTHKAERLRLCALTAQPERCLPWHILY
jgi:hypothetical protein